MRFDTLIIVPARSGSKGLEDKNIKPLGGKPLLQWTIDAIQAAQLPSSLAILSTDSKAYAELGRAAGLTVPFLRPLNYAQDDTPMLAVAEHALSWFEQAFGYLPRQVLLLQPTSPFRGAKVLRAAIALLHNSDADAIVACQTIYRDLSTLFRIEQGYLAPLSPNQQVQTCRQNSPPLLTPNGALYLCEITVLQQRHSFYGQRTVPLYMDAVGSLDIDDATDWRMAEAFIAAGLVNELNHV